MKHNKDQMNLFGVNDTPLFSGTPVRVKVDDYNPVKRDIEGYQSNFMDIPIPEAISFTCPECGVGLLPIIDGAWCLGRFICGRCANTI